MSLKINIKPTYSSSDEDEEPVQDISNKIETNEEVTSNEIIDNTEDVNWMIQNDEERELMDLMFGGNKKFINNLKKTIDDDKVKKESASTKRKPVWHDSDDEEITVGEALSKNKSRRKQEIFDTSSISDTKYNDHLKDKFSKLVGNPKWTNLDRENGSDDDSDKELLQTAGHVVKKNSTGVLLKNNLSHKKLKDLNRATYSEGPKITSVRFHPTSMVAVVTGHNGIATIYSVDDKSDKLHTVSFKKFPIRCCRIKRDGEEAILGSSLNYCYIYNLITGQVNRVFLYKGITKMSKFEMSPCGNYLATPGRFGEVHLMNSHSKEWICTLKQNDEITAIDFSRDSNQMFCHGSGSQVSIFDIRSQKLMHHWFDDGCLNGTTIELSPNGKLLATGSGQGIVNVYNTDDTLQNKTPRPFKTFTHLRTCITSTAFNSTSEILAMCSNDVDEAIKVAHFPSATIFCNFPGHPSKIGKVNTLSFSPGSRYFAVGNRMNKVSLYRLNHFNFY